MMICDLHINDKNKKNELLTGKCKRCYTSGVYDELTGLYYLNARYYNPSTATFITQDSYRGKQKDYDTWNLYAYCGGNPINYVNPSGHNAAAVPLYTYGAANAWNPSGWIAIEN